MRKIIEKQFLSLKSLSSLYYLEFSSEYLIANYHKGLLCVDVDEGELCGLDVGQILLNSAGYRDVN